MKSVILATAIAFTSTAALAADVGVSGEVAYSIDNEAFAMEVGPDFYLGAVVVTPRLYASLASSDFNVDGVGVEAEYGVTTGVTVFGAIQADADLNYTDAQVGVRFQF